MNESHVRKNGNKRILVVDDTPANLRLLMDMLGKHGYQIHPVNSGVLALRFLESTLPDLILLDILMPGMDGYEVCRHLKANERTRDIPVIFISAVGEVLDKVNAFSVGAVDYVVKPFQIEEVLARINTHLLLRGLQRSLEERVHERTTKLIEANARLNEEVAERNRAEEALRTSEERYRALYNDTPSMYLTVSPDGIVQLINQFGLSQLGYAPEELIGQSVLRIFADCDQEAAAEYLAECMAHPDRVFHWELRKIRKDGHVMWVKETARAVQDPGGAPVLLIVCEDITERKHAEERIRYLAHHDALTGLPNRTLMEDRVNQAIAQARRFDQLVAMLFLDLDSFKNINDSLGHQVGDHILKVVAERLLACLRKGDSVARLGGDEFVLNLPALSHSRDATHVAQKVLDVLDMPLMIDGHDLHVSGSIGISLFPEDGEDAEALMRAADTAMYHAKAKGRRNFQFFTQELNQVAQQRLLLESRLRQAIARNEFELYYQPQVDIDSGKTLSAEALLRWQQPGAPAVSCAEFISIAEDSGLILPIGLWALRRACEQTQAWRSNGHPELHIAVNLSARQFYQADFQNAVRRILDETGLPPEALDLEITESLLVQPNDDNLEILKQLSAMGIQLSLDDFGTGYSSLSYLQRFPINALKIDRSFVNRIGHDMHDTAIVSAIIALAQSLHLKVVAEGVESIDQVHFLRNCGCCTAQGYYYSEPLPAEAFGGRLNMQRH